MGGPFWSFQGPETDKICFFQGPEKAPFWRFQEPEILIAFLEFSAALIINHIKQPYFISFRPRKKPKMPLKTPRRDVFRPLK